MARRRWTLAPLIAGLAVVASCATTPVRTPAASAAPPSATPSPAIQAGARLDVRFSGKIGCGTFPYGCRATLSVLPPDTPVADDWRSPSSDPWWPPDGAGSLALAPVGALPTIPLGRHRVVVSLVGSYDTPSYKPDGSIATDLLSRCIGDFDVRPETDVVTVRITFTPDPASFRASCVLSLE